MNMTGCEIDQGLRPRFVRISRSGLVAAVVFLSACQSETPVSSPVDDSTNEIALVEQVQDPLAYIDTAFNDQPNQLEVITKAYQDALTFYGNGDFDQSFPILKRLAENGYVNGQVLLSDHYRRGAGVVQDFDMAVQLLKEASKGGSVVSNFILGNYYYEGTGGVVVDRQLAIDYWQAAAEKGYAPAVERLETLGL